MKQYFLKTICVASLAVLAVPSFAQNEKEQKEKEMKEKVKEDVQQIIITRKGNTSDKTVIEIDGDKVKVNGKDVSDNKDITVNMNRFKNMGAIARMRTPGAGTYNFNMDDNHISLFSEDDNRAMLGVVTDEDDKGAKISSVTKESAAEKAGLKSGDIITRIDNKKIENAEDVSEAVHAHKPGDKIALTILRDGKEQKINTELGKWKGIRFDAFNAPTAIAPQVWQSMPPVPPTRGFNMNGNTFTYNNGPKLGLSVQDTDDGKGVKVLDADEEGNAAKAGIKEGDIITSINDKDVNSTDEISRAVRENKDKSAIKVKLLRNGKSQTIDVRMPRKLKTTDL